MSNVVYPPAHWRGPAYHPHLIASEVFPVLRDVLLDLRGVMMVTLEGIDTPFPYASVILRHDDTCKFLTCIYAFTLWAFIAWPDYPGFAEWDYDLEVSEVVFVVSGRPLGLEVRLPGVVHSAHVENAPEAFIANASRYFLHLNRPLSVPGGTLSEERIVAALVSLTGGAA